MELASGGLVIIRGVVALKALHKGFVGEEVLELDQNKTNQTNPCELFQNGLGPKVKVLIDELEDRCHHG